MTSDNFFKKALEGATFSFSHRPEPIAGDLRMSWGISIVLLALFNCRGKKSSFPKLQLLAHSVRSEKSREDMRALLQGRLRVTDISVRVEPWLNRAVNYAHGLSV